jgi:hypothetical protein
MSKEQLVEIANNDTPQGVEIPGNWPGIFAWVLGRFGLGVGVAIVFGWFTVRVYEDLQRQNDRILDAFRQQTSSNAEHVHAIRELAKRIEDAHRRASEGLR